MAYHLTVGFSRVAERGEVPARVGHANAGISRLTLSMLMFNICLFF